MTRKIVAVENKETPDKRLICRDALTWRSEPIPVMVHSALSKVIGQARSFERDLNGFITADVMLTDAEYENYYCAIDVVDVDVQMQDGVLNVLKGRIACVVVIPYWMWGTTPPVLPRVPV